MTSVFFSYSHRDEALRNELEIHLAGLKRQGLIDTWHDRRILAGDELDPEISEHLEHAEVILLLVSPDFIASDYCYSVEAKRALERHASGQARVIPVILRPCDWTDLPFGKLLATPTDGKPVTKHAAQDDAFLDVTKAIKAAIQGLTKSIPKPANNSGLPTIHDIVQAGAVMPEVRSSNLRVKKQFGDRERDEFITEAFEFVANYFEGSLQEIKARNTELETSFRRIDANTFTVAIYRRGSKIASCRIRIGDISLVNGLTYTAGDSREGNSYNEMLSVTDDGYSLLFRPMLGFLRPISSQTSSLTIQGAAEYLWSALIEPLQR